MRPLLSTTIYHRCDGPLASAIRPTAVRTNSLLLGLALLFLAVTGCTDVSRSSFDAVKLAVHPHPKLAITAEEVAAKPYYQLEATGPHGTAVLILGNVDGMRQAWYGARGVVIFIEHGRVVQSAGLDQNLDDVQLPANDPFLHGLQTLRVPLDYRFAVDWSPGYRYGVPINARLIPMGTEPVNILGITRQLLRVDELLDVTALHYRATNRYWVDPRDGFVWKSVQQIAPGLSLQLVQLRPYRESPP